jgi:hypothetical protein
MLDALLRERGVDAAAGEHLARDFRAGREPPAHAERSADPPGERWGHLLIVRDPPAVVCQPPYNGRAPVIADGAATATWAERERRVKALAAGAGPGRLTAAQAAALTRRAWDAKSAVRVSRVWPDGTLELDDGPGGGGDRSYLGGDGVESHASPDELLAEWRASEASRELPLPSWAAVGLFAACATGALAVTWLIVGVRGARLARKPAALALAAFVPAWLAWSWLYFAWRPGRERSLAFLLDRPADAGVLFATAAGVAVTIALWRRLAVTRGLR